MKMNIPQEKALRWTAQGLTIVAVAAAAVAAVLYSKVDELEASASQTRVQSENAAQLSAAARKKLQDELKAAGDKAAALEQQLNEMEKFKILLAKVEPQIAVALEAVAGAKASKPDARAGALTGLGLIGQIVHGAKHEAALANLDRALLVDKTACVASLAVKLGGAKQIEVAPDCQALLPAAPAAAESKPAAEAKPAAKPEAAAAGEAAKSAPAAVKN